jgi:hypothetical protein
MLSPVLSSLPLDPAVYGERFRLAARAAGFRVESFGEIQGLPLLAATKRTAGPRPRIYLSTGIHGDEPAPPWSVLRLLEEGFFDDRCTWFLCPLLNPTGFLRRTRENAESIDLNRDYLGPRSAETAAHVAWLQRQPAFDLGLCLHEDWEATGFYLYELNPRNRPTLAPAMIAAARELGPIEAATTIDARAVTEPGLIRPLDDPLLHATWPEAVYLHHFHCSLGYTVETSSAQPLEQRVAIHRAVAAAAVGSLLAPALGGSY